MCDVMIIALRLSDVTNDRDETRPIAWRITKDLGVSAFEKHLGVHFALPWRTTPGVQALLKRLKLVDRKGGERFDTVVFEVTSTPLEICICDALPNVSDDLDPRPEESPLYKFLEDVFSTEAIEWVLIYFGPPPREDKKFLRSLTKKKRTPERFLHHLVSEDTEEVLGIGEWCNLYKIRLKD